MRNGDSKSLPCLKERRPGLLVNYLATSFALIDYTKIQYCQTVREFYERRIKVARSLSGIPSFANSVVAETRIEYDDVPTIFNSHNNFQVSPYICDRSRRKAPSLPGGGF
ncbi:MAG: hypothetical protein EZS28_001456 [Streblomastix strix]|uniref:Uncharacterized protein n=1 Tax=Streblomastix strix TaxID=222440 RepID=A0A5J4X7J7_9EUKA|nr:MAG: hypothetical protein EZS28_001456 [Streblomastix strix]